MHFFKQLSPIVLVKFHMFCFIYSNVAGHVQQHRQDCEHPKNAQFDINAIT